MHKTRGFTLVELLVVMFIIGVLMGLLLPAVLGAKQRARESRRMAERKTLVNAMKAYYSEYGEWPCPARIPSSPDATYDDNNNYKVVNYLRIGSPPPTNNPKNILFLQLDSYRTDSQGNLLNPWGDPYVIKFDTDGNGKVSYGGDDSWSGVLVY